MNMIASIEATYPTVVFHSHATVKIPRAPILVFIPGNPGLVGYYTEYLTALQKRIPSFEILAISYAGFTHNDSENENRVIGLQQQADHKLDIIKKYVKGSRDVYLLGHSVGCYIAQRVILKLETDNDPLLKQIQFVGFITPTIKSIGLSANGVWLSNAFKWIPDLHVLVSRISFLTRLIPESITEFLIKQKLQTESPSAILETKTLIQSRNLILKALGLAKEEMKIINKDDILTDTFFNILTTKAIKFWGFFCHTDYWIHNDTREYLIDKYAGKLARFEVHHDINLKHSFCIRSSELFAAITEKALVD